MQAFEILPFFFFFLFSPPLRRRKDAGEERPKETQRAGADILTASFLAEKSTQRCSAGWEGGSFGEMTLCFNFSLFFIAFHSVSLLERNITSQF